MSAPVAVQPGERAQQASLSGLSVPVEGMTCASCVGRVELALNAVPGVSRATVNLATERAEVGFSGKADARAVVQAIEAVGYAAREDVIELAIDEMTCASCVGRVEKVLAAVAGVLEASVNLATGRARVRHVAGAVLLGDLQAAVAQAGYTARRLSVETPDAWSLFGTLAIAAMAAYALARFDFPGNRALFLFFISGMMIPAQLLLIPIFFQYSYLSDLGTQLLQPFGLRFQLYDSHFGLILLYIALSLPFTILVLSGFFKSLPGELREAAIMDGCGEYRVFWHVMLPLAKPGLITAAIFNFLGFWNEYIFALVFVNTPENKTLPLGLASVSMQAQYRTDFGLLFAALVIVVLPTLWCTSCCSGNSRKGSRRGR